MLGLDALKQDDDADCPVVDGGISIVLHAHGMCTIIMVYTFTLPIYLRRMDDGYSRVMLNVPFD